MLQDERTLVVVADGGHARLLEERRRGGPLYERGDWSEDLISRHAVRVGSSSRVFDRFGLASHPIGDLAPREKAEEALFKTLAARVGELATKENFDAIVLIAPPRALGRLRAALPLSARDRVRHAEPKDRAKEDIGAIREALAGIRGRGA